MHAFPERSAPLPVLRVDVTDADPAAPPAGAATLAVFRFGTPLPASADGRYHRVALPLHGPPRQEAWSVRGPVQHGQSDGIAWSRGGGLACARLDVVDDGDIEAASARAYASLRDWQHANPGLHLLRIWNFLDAITEGEDDEERYRRFCVGRARGIGQPQAPSELPAATAIGHPQRTGRLQLIWLAAEEPGTPLENPRQVQAWRYPRRYGPQAPGFARALLPAAPAMPLLLSGTAAVVGHASRHAGALGAQLDEVLVNLQCLVDAGRALRPGLPPQLGPATCVRAYVRDADALGHVDARLALLLPDVPRLVLHGQICRRELLVELDGCHG